MVTHGRVVETHLYHLVLDHSELLEKRVIHEYPRLEIPAAARHLYEAYLLDYGLWLDWKHDSSRTSRTPHDPIVFPANSQALDRHVLRLRGLDRRTATCVQCDAVFPREARSYVVRGLCPECYRPADLARQAGIVD